MSTTAPVVEAARELVRRGVGGDPYATYRRLREEAPALVLDGTCLVSRFDDVKAVLRDARLFQSGPNSQAGRKQTSARIPDVEGMSGDEMERYLDEFIEFQRPTLTRTDGDLHDRMRSAFRHLFTPREVERQRALVESVVSELLDAWDGESEVDALSTFALRLPLNVITDLIGAPREDAWLIRQWSTDIFPGGKDLRTTHAAIEGLTSYLPRLIERRPVDPDHGRGILLETLLTSRDEGILDTQEMASNMVNLLFAGHETTTNLIGNGLYWTLRHRGQWERLVADPSLVRPALEEFVRFESPVQYLGRTVSEDTEVAGTPLRAGTAVIPLLGAANRDPDHFDDPDVLDVDRPRIDHVGYGVGVHFCIGAFLARLEGEVGFTALLERYPDMRLVESEPSWRENHLFRGLDRLLVRPRG